ncbi:MAG TPA: alpha/beta hydrolase, partial [Hyphomicrobiaceae bacterium]
MVRLLRALALGSLLLAPPAAWADQAVQVGGAMALLNKPAAPRASIILIPGGNGYLGVNADGSFTSLKGNQLVRTRKAYLAYGVATLTIDSGVNVAEAVAYMRKIARPVVVVGT